MPQISVIVPVYNAESYLKRCIDSIIAQTYKDFELILVDDGSPDKSGAICDKYAIQDQRVTVIHQKNQGVGGARKTGLAYATGEYVIHADPDDWVERDWLNVLYKKAKDEDADMVICDYYQEFDKFQIIKKQKPNSFICEELVLDLLNGSLWGPMWNKIIKRSTISNNEIDFDANMSYLEDLFFIVRLLMCNIKVSYIAQSLYHYDYHSNINSIVREANPRHVESMKKFLDFVILNYGGNQRFQESINMLINRIKRKAFYCGIKNNRMVIDLYSSINEQFTSQNQHIRGNVVNYCVALCIKGHKYWGHLIYGFWKYLYVPFMAKLVGMTFYLKNKIC